MTALDTRGIALCGTVTAMVTKTKTHYFFLKEWRKFTGTKAIAIAEALGIERESYYRLERDPGRIKITQQIIIAKTFGIRPDQLWSAPPAADVWRNISLDDLIENAPINIQEMAIRAVRGMVGK